jgi:type I restriction-modification system DNA methylase subunit
MSVPDQIQELVERFKRNLDAYRSGQYNETQLRREFLDPFFEALGWDVNNERGYAEAYKEVIHEDAIKVGGATKAPDYCFRIGGVRKFFLEAKKPSVNLRDEITPAFQLRRYAWSAKLPVSILSDFEEFAVYDCRIKPLHTDKASAARIQYLTYNEYAEKWEDIASIFSRDSILKGSFDKYAESARGKRGTAEVDNAFLKDIEFWRDVLARNIALRNPNLTQRELNFSIQRIIDRIIFLRICEDRSIESYGALMALLNGENVYKRLCKIFYRADERYNSGLFNFQTEKGRTEPPDELTISLEVDDKPLKDLMRGLYYPESPYEFSVLPADILGQVYEQFLGKVIRLTAGHRAVVEDKPEVKKAGGVYYTPTYIVDYIVKNTVGKLLEDKTPKQVSKLRVLDPACGSGSFLIVAYQYLLDWHRDRYVADGPEKHTAELYQLSGGDWRLTTAERKRILLNNIYGVDIDAQAVEVTKLSLLLKVLEGENEQTLTKQFRLFHERALPDLASNIKCGNSLIGPDFYDRKQVGLLNDEERYRINVFDWNGEFAEIMKAGGFDVVIGNPPYGSSFREIEAQYFADKYRVLGGVRDVYVCFMERGLVLLRSRGFFSFIVPSAWLGGPAYQGIRELLLRHQMGTVVLLPFDVFRDAYVDTTIFVVHKQHPTSSHESRTYVYGKREKLRNINLMPGDYQLTLQDQWAHTELKKFILDPVVIRLVQKLHFTAPLSFDDVVRVKRGVLFDKKYLTKKQTSRTSHPYFEGDVYRYQLKQAAGSWVEFDDRMKERPKEFIWFEGRRILLRRLVNRRRRLMATLVADTFITSKNLYSLLGKTEAVSILAILGVLNSKLISHLYVKQVTQASKDDFPQVTIKDLLALPFPDLARDESGQQRMMKLAERFLSLQEHFDAVRTDHEKIAIQREIDATDKQIDALVYELYGLTEEEIQTVEEGG